MTKLVRKTQVIFGASAGGSQMGQFGSLAAGLAAYSTDPALIQTSAWSAGWFNAVVGINSPCIEDWNAACYVPTYQLAYLFQEGIAEWDAGTTYVTGSFCQDGSGNLYVSQAATNLNNALTNTTYWLPYVSTMAASTVATSVTGNIASGSSAMSSVSSTTSVYVGALISATGVPASTYVTAISGSTVYMSKAATATTTGVAVSFQHSIATAATLKGQIDQVDAYLANADNACLPLGSIIATFPSLTGAYSTTATTVADASGFVLCQGQTIADASSPMNGVVVPNISAGAFIYGGTSAGATGGSATSNALLAHSHGSGSFATSLGLTSGSSSLTGTTTFAADGHHHNFGIAYCTNQAGLCEYGTGNGENSMILAWNGQTGTNQFAGSVGSGTNVTTVNNGWALGAKTTSTTGTIWGNVQPTDNNSSSASVGLSYSSPSLTGSNAVSGTSSSAGSGSSFSIMPPYITAVYLMRVR